MIRPSQKNPIVWTALIVKILDLVIEMHCNVLMQGSWVDDIIFKSENLGLEQDVHSQSSPTSR